MGRRAEHRFRQGDWELCTNYFKFDTHIRYPTRLAKLGVEFYESGNKKIGTRCNTNAGVIRT